MKKILFFLLLTFFVYRSTNAQWSYVNYTYSMEVYGIHFINDQIGFAAGYHQVYKTTDGGSTWTEISSSVFINGPVGVWFMSESIGFIIGSDAGGNPQVSKTINGGTSWTTTTLPVGGMGFNDPNKIFFFDNNTGYIVCRSGYIYRTINQGVDWFQLTSGTIEDITSVYFPTSSIGFASLMYSNTLLKTITGGNSWTSLNLGQTIGVNDLYFTSADTGYLACSNSKIIKTTDGGSTWNVFNLGTSDVFFTIEFTSKNIGYAAGSSGIIVTTTNGGTTWVPSLSGATEHLRCMDFPSQAIGYIGALAGGGPGKIIKTTNGGGVLSVAEIKENPYFKVYPNPANDVFTITANKFLPGSTYFITDQLGRIVLSGKLTNETTKVDISQLATGVYLLQLGEQKKQSLKVIKK